MVLVGGSSPLTRGKLPLQAVMSREGGLIPAHAGKTPPRKQPWTSTWAHPRSRGENAVVGGEGDKGDGSSPLTRGKRGDAPPGPASFGLIPAHAGKTAASRGPSLLVGAHPRSRGENWVLIEAFAISVGSSPLTRGKLTIAWVVSRIFGLIPAHAGKTKNNCSITWTRRAHPRSRGENHARGSNPALSPGSSPLTRGKLRCLVIPPGPVGLIPAHAGKTAAIKTLACTYWAHPRSRGENAELETDAILHQGSSPLTRGKRPGIEPGFILTGLIPAHAGKTSSLTTLPSKHGAHPRSRGENTMHVAIVGFVPGSSPLTRGKPFGERSAYEQMRLIPAHAGKTAREELVTEASDGSSPLTRGKLALETLDDTRGGLIPAHAGKTRPCPQAWQWSGAHPRSRGENTMHVAIVGFVPGSSPLTRGKRHESAQQPTVPGLIPAHAGKTSGDAHLQGHGGAHPRSRGENSMSSSTSASIAGSSPLTRGKPNQQ